MLVESPLNPHRTIATNCNRGPLGSWVAWCARQANTGSWMGGFSGPTTFDGHMGLLVYLEDLLGRRVDVVTAKGLKPRMRPQVEKDLVRVA